MSTILDALKKSERERTVLRGLGFSDAGWRPARDIDWLRWVVVGSIVALTLVAIAVVVLRAGVVPIKSSTAVSVPEPKAPAVEAARPAALPADNAALPADASSALADAAVASLPKVPVVVRPGKTEFLNAMSPDFQRMVPPMTVNIHVYAPEESRRILYINNRQYRGGDEISGGVRVEEIIPEGVVLQFQGQRFKLARPS
jgi:hypothetical protein